jgi:hypothetical protein
MLNLARARGLILSPEDGRSGLADSLSAMIFGFEDVRALEAEFDRAGRGEKTTFFRLNTALTTAEIKAIADEYRDGSDADRVATYMLGTSGVAVDVKYTETDFSKTRLRQRQTKEARIEFKIEDGHTVVTLPATEKARSVAQHLRERLRAKREAELAYEEVDLSAVQDLRLRTQFFTRLISSLAGLQLHNVTRVKVDTAEDRLDPSDDEAGGEEADEMQEASAQMLGVVKAVALHGESLLSSLEYQNLSSKGFFITSITWSAKRTESPFQIVQFDAGFDDPSLGQGFKYAVRGWSTQRNGNYSKSFRPMLPEDKKVFLAVIERTAITVFRELRSDAQTPSSDEAVGADRESA